MLSYVRKQGKAQQAPAVYKATVACRRTSSTPGNGRACRRSAVALSSVDVTARQGLKQNTVIECYSCTDRELYTIPVSMIFNNGITQ
jgi:hypothetical protein